LTAPETQTPAIVPETPLKGSDCGRPARPSYLDIELTGDGLNLFERQGDGKTAVLVDALKRYGLRLTTRVSSPCG